MNDSFFFRKTIFPVLTLLLFSLFCNNLIAQDSRPKYIAKVSPVGSKYWGYVDENGKMIIRPSYERCFDFSATDGIAIVYDVDARHFFLIDTKGTKIPLKNKKLRFIGADYLTATGFNSGLAAVEEGDKWGFINTNGELAIPLQYLHVKQFDKGYTIVKNKEKEYLILKSNGQEISLPNQKEILFIRKFSDGLAAFRTKKRKWGFLNTDGTVEIEAQFLHVDDFKGGYARAKDLKGNIGYIDTKGIWIVQPQFLAGHPMDFDCGIARVKKKDGNWTYVNDEDEQIEMDANIIEKLYDFHEGLAIGVKNGLFGFYNEEAVWQIEPKYEAVSPFENGFAAAKTDGKWGIIDTKSNWVIQPVYEKIRNFVRME